MGQSFILFGYASKTTGEVWAWKNPEIRAQTNPTMGRDFKS